MIGTEIGAFGALGLLVLVLVFLGVFLYLVPIPLWIAAWASGAYVGLFTLIAMRLRRVPPSIVVTARISAVKAGLNIPLNDLEAHYLAGGNVVNVVNAMISADKANIPMPFNRASAIDLAGRDVLAAVQMSVIPKVIETPRIAAVAKDGIQLIAVSRVTVRTNIDRLVGGAGEETVIARVGEGMVSTIGSATTHKAVLENPDHISKHVLSKGLDAGTAYEILSIDIADVDVGENIGAKLQIDQANADKQIAQAKAEERRAMAVALEQEMRARVVEAEAEVPRAMAQAFREGHLGIMDYYRMQNVQADTVMREALAGDEPGPRHPPGHREVNDARTDTDRTASLRVSSDFRARRVAQETSAPGITGGQARRAARSRACANAGATSRCGSTAAPCGAAWRTATDGRLTPWAFPPGARVCRQPARGTSRHSPHDNSRPLPCPGATASAAVERHNPDPLRGHRSLTTAGRAKAGSSPCPPGPK